MNKIGTLLFLSVPKSVLLFMFFITPGLVISQFELATQHKVNNHTIPFYEGWNSGDFETNQWTVTGSNWIIDTLEGNQAPSVKFNSTPVQNNYSFSLESDLIDAEDPHVGTIILQLDYKIVDSIANGTEYLLLNIVTDTDTIEVFHVYNIFEHDWYTTTKNITQYVAGKSFKLIFEAYGTSTSNFSGWYIDNIEIYYSCDRPVRLTGEQYWNNQN